MSPINNVFLGGAGDPLLGDPTASLDAQLEMIEAYQRKLQALKQTKAQITAAPQAPTKLIWDEIDAEVMPLTDDQKAKLFRDEEYVDNYNTLQGMVQAEILNLVKGRIEGTSEGKELLTNQLKIVKKLKNKIIDETNKEMEVFRRFKEYAKTHPSVTYEEFIKENV